MDGVNTRSRATAAQMRERIGSDFGTSDWMLLDQARISAFATLTEDEYFIHTDPVRAAKETPYGGTIAHGFLTLSLLAQMGYQVCPAVEGTKSGVNYGFNRLRFVAPVKAGSRVRGRFRLKDFEAKPGDRWNATWEVTIEIEGGGKPAIAAEWLNAGFF
ncbi:MAG: MaoC family dehydratase [Betaproteobacteria bacterium]|nr:MaoC family dehydratase [Betaproteobacteria bacterium]